MAKILPVLFLILCGPALLSAFEEMICDGSGEHQCVFVEHKTIRTTTTMRRWYCLWLCTTEYTQYRIKRIQTCDCCPGWIMNMTTTACTRCDPERFGRQCRGECSCEGDGRCDSFDGSCYCMPGMGGRGCLFILANCTDGNQRTECMGGNCNDQCINGEKCNHTTNECECPPKWRGDKCQFFSGCPGGFYGKKCDYECSCSNNSTCDGLTGECYCLAGWTGSTCEDHCELGKYGRNCSQSCDCHNNELRCDPVDGRCPCPRGFYGFNCSIECPTGFYGKDCQHECACNDSNSVCNKTTGVCTAGPTQEKTSGGLSQGDIGILIGLSAAGVISFIIVIVVCRKRKQIAKDRKTTAPTQTDLALTANAATGIRNEYEKNLYEVSQDPSIYSEPNDGRPTGSTAAVRPSQKINAYINLTSLAQDEPCLDGYGHSGDYNCLDRSVLKSSIQMPTNHNDYTAIQPTAESDDDYSHLDRSHRAPSTRSTESTNYEATRPIDEQEGGYSSLGRELKRSDESNHDNKYESLAVYD